MAELHFDIIKDILKAKPVLHYGEKGLSYVYNRRRYNTEWWNKHILTMCWVVQKQTGYKFNSAILEYFRDGKTSLPWHSDLEKELWANPIVAIMSFGSARVITFKHKVTFQTYSVNLASGSLLLMERGCQEEWLYCMPVSKTQAGKRITITFRYIRN
jgi:alkylated DNA repair dioxygenase AlkB